MECTTSYFSMWRMGSQTSFCSVGFACDGLGEVSMKKVTWLVGKAASFAQTSRSHIPCLLLSYATIHGNMARRELMDSSQLQTWAVYTFFRSSSVMDRKSLQYSTMSLTFIWVKTLVMRLLRSASSSSATSAAFLGETCIPQNVSVLPYLISQAKPHTTKAAPSCNACISAQGVKELSALTPPAPSTS